MENNTVIGNIISEEKGDNIILKSTQNIFCNSFYFQDLYDDSAINKFIKKVEYTVRHSAEYTDYLSLLKTNYNILNYDNVQSNIGDSDASVEIHHYPFTLYEIADIVMTNHLLKKENFTSFTLAKEIMDLHFEHKIGFVPLITTNHELAHNDAIFISLKQVFGDWCSFYKDYNVDNLPEYKAKIDHLKELSTAGMKSDYKGILK